MVVCGILILYAPKVAPPHASKEKASRSTSLASTAPSTRSSVRTLVARRDWWAKRREREREREKVSEMEEGR